MLKWLIPLLLLPAFSLGQVSKLRQQAQQGDAKAMISLSEKYLFGFGAPKNEDSASFWLKKALDTGDPEAQYLVGVQYAGMAFDAPKFKEGVGLLEKAAAQEHPEALLRLSEIYRSRGKGTESDRYYSPAKAYGYAERAALQDNAEALHYCAEARLTGNGTSPDDSLALAYMRRAATQLRFIPAKLRLADMLLQGIGAPQIDPFGALALYQEVISMRRSNIEQRSEANLGVHRVDRILRQWQNAANGAAGILPQSIFDFQIRE